MMRLLPLLVATLCLVASHQIEAQLRFRKAGHDGACGVEQSELSRREIKPSHYELALNLNLNKEKFGGLVEIDVEIFGRSEDRANEIWLDADGTLDIRAAEFELIGKRSVLSAFMKSPANQVEVLEACLNTKHRILVLTLDQELQVGAKGKLTISYEGQYGQFGLRKKSHQFHSDEDEPDVKFALKPNHARRLLPCFDEAQFESTFRLTVKRFPHLAATSNTAKESDLVEEIDGPKVVAFKQTEPIRVDELQLEMRA